MAKALHLKRSISSILAASLGLAMVSTPGSASDFSRVQRVYVPASRIQRRIDLDNTSPSSYGDPMSYGGYQSGMAAGYAAPPPPDKLSAPPSKYGLIPPPPPITPSIVPQADAAMGGYSSMQTGLPPTLAGTYASGASSASASAANWRAKIADAVAKMKTNQTVTSAVDQAREKAQELINEGRLGDAETQIKSYLKSFPKDAVLEDKLVVAAVGRAKYFLNNHDLESSLKEAREALAVEPGNTQAKSVMGEILHLKGVDVDDVNARLKMARSLAAEGKDVEAEAEYKAALEMKPSVEGYIGLAGVQMKQGNKDEAKAELQKAVDLEPSSVPALRALGTLKYSQNDIVGANSDLSRALTIDPTDAGSKKTLFELWQRQVSHNPKDANAHLGLARAYQLGGDLPSAQSEYRQVVRLDPNNPNLPAARQSFKLALARQEARRSLEAAKTLESHGAIKEAYQKAMEAVGLCPQDVPCRLYLAQMNEKMGYYNQAHDNYMLVLNQDPKNVTAAQRIKALSDAGLITPYLTSNVMPQTAMSAGPALALSQAGGVPLRGMEAPPAATLAPPPAAALAQAQATGQAAQTAAAASETPAVNNMSNFLVQLRNLSLTNKKQAEQAEDAVHSALNKAFSPPSQASAPTATASAGAGGGGLNGMLDSINNDSASINKLLASSKATLANLGLSQAPTPGATGATIAAPAAAVAPQAVAVAPALIQSATTPPPVAPDVTSQMALSNLTTAYQRLGSLEAQNRQLQTQLNQAQQAIQGLQQSLLTSRPNLSTVPTNTMSEPPAPSPAPTGPAVIPQAKLPAALPAAGDDLMPAPSLLPPIPTQQIPNTQSMAAPTGNPVRFELEGVSASPSAIKLKVVLKNEGAQPLSMKGSTPNVVIRMTGRPDRTVKAAFPEGTVPPGGELHGTIKVPGHDLNPTADLYIPNFLPAIAGSDPDVHLTVPISSL